MENSDFKKNLAFNLNLISARWGMKQKQLIDLFPGIKASALSSYFSETSIPKIGFFVRLHELTGISIENFYMGLLNTYEIPDQPLIGSGDNPNNKPKDKNQRINSKLKEIERIVAEIKSEIE